MQIAQDGDIQLQIEQRTALGGIPDLDVDFVVYGPFNDPTSACVSELTFANIVDCSRRIDLVEFVDITNTKAGEYYLLLITNFTGKPGFITVTQISGAATTNYLHTDLDNGRVYAYRVIAQNEIGNSEPSDPVSLRAAVAPEAPDAPVKTFANGSRIEIAWNAPADIGGSSITKYEVFMDDTQGAGF